MKSIGRQPVRKSIVARSQEILRGANQILQKALTCDTEEELGRVCLQVAEGLSQSEFGFIGLVDAQGLLFDIAISNPGWEVCRMGDQTGHKLPTGLKIHGIYGRVLRDGKGFFTNNPAAHPDSIGLPPGHPPLTAFLGVPLLEEQNVIGMVAVANRAGGYRREDLFALETLAVAIVQALKRKRMEEQLRFANQATLREQNFLEAVLQALPVGVCITDRQGGIIRTNHMDREIWGDRPATAGLGDYHEYNAWWTDTGEPVQPGEWASARAVINGESVFGQILKIQRFDGQFRIINNSASPVFDSNGGIIGSAVSIQDITSLWELTQALKEAKRVAEEANQAKSDFLSNVSHEIRTPMTVFMSAIEQLQHLDRDPEHRQLLDLADQASKRLHILINDILDFSRIEAHRVELSEDRFNLHACLRDTVTLLTGKAGEKRLGLVLHIAPDVPEHILGDRQRLDQILVNLIHNAIKFTDRGEIKIAVQCHADTLEFTVSDTGIGIPEELQQKIFQTFSQVDSSSTRRHGGTGLGLAICKGLVELMGGRIGVRSKPGQGSVFIFTLPLKSPPRSAKSARVEQPDLAATERSEARILLAEDNPMVRDVIMMILSRRPWRVTTAGTGLEAVQKWQAEKFDLIVMDLQMPGMDGIEATRQIRGQEADTGNRVAIVGLTAHASHTVRKECIAAGMNEIVVKPFETAGLYAVIERCLPK